MDQRSRAGWNPTGRDQAAHGSASKTLRSPAGWMWAALKIRARGTLIQQCRLAGGRAQNPPGSVRVAPTDRVCAQQRDGLLVVEAHAAEDVADVLDRLGLRPLLHSIDRRSACSVGGTCHAAYSVASCPSARPCPSRPNVEVVDSVGRESAALGVGERGRGGGGGGSYLVSTGQTAVGREARVVRGLCRRRSVGPVAALRPLLAACCTLPAASCTVPLLFAAFCITRCPWFVACCMLLSVACFLVGVARCPVASRSAGCIACRPLQVCMLAASAADRPVLKPICGPAISSIATTCTDNSHSFQPHTPERPGSASRCADDRVPLCASQHIQRNARTIQRNARTIQRNARTIQHMHVPRRGCRDRRTTDWGACA
jgi:hypothetical protein